jgi:PAS domain S-box-containing protein
LLPIDFLIGCCFPIAATLLDLWWKGQPFSLASALAAQTSQPLHWVIDSIPLLLVLGKPRSQSGHKATASIPRTSGNVEQQISERTAKLAKQLADLKAEVATLKQSEETLRAREEHYRNLVENTNDGILTLSLDGTITTVNHGLELLLGKHRDDLIGRHCSIVLPSSSLVPIDEQIRRFRNGEKSSVTLALTFFHQNGKTIPVETRLQPLLDKEGMTDGIQGICRETAPQLSVSPPPPLSPSFTDPATTQNPSQGSFSNIPLASPPGLSQLPAITESAASSPLDNRGVGLSLSPSFTSSFSLPEAGESSLVSPSSSYSTLGVSSEPLAAPLHRTGIYQPNSQHEPPLPSAQGGGQSEQVIDLGAALSRVDGDRELLVEMAELFLDESPRLLTTLRDAVAHGNAQTAAYAAHTLKGSVANFAATPAFTAAQKIERMARQGDLSQAQAAFADLEAQLKRLEPVLTNLKVEAVA